ncbi:MAG: phytanoyl-CoA dioxygenase family protein [Saprospirales bacterium]|nr:phytanoyl-CoA dioxygenase family protein [Saprospirales bacterium]
MKAGEAILFNYKTVHASMPNLSNEPRIAISLWVAEKNSKYFTNYLKPGTTNKLLKYEIDRAFYVKFSDKILSEMYNANKFLEDYKLVQEDNYIWKKLIMEELEGQLDRDNNYNKNNLLYFSVI